MRNIKYKEPSASFNKMATPDLVSTNRASIGMDSFVGEYYYISLEKLVPFKNQSRTKFNEDELVQLADTIKEHGVRQPLSVIKSETFPGKYEVVSGERRLRASKIAGLEKVPCIILESTLQIEEIALIENIQRSDLHLLEFARGLKKLIDNYGWGGQTQIHNSLGIPTNRISEAIKLLDLSPEIQLLAIEKNYTGREKLLGLLKLNSDEERRNRILGEKTKGQKNQASFSVLRIKLDDGRFKIQKNSLKNLNSEQRINLKKELSSIIKELD